MVLFRCRKCPKVFSYKHNMTRHTIRHQTMPDCQCKTVRSCKCKVVRKAPRTPRKHLNPTSQKIFERVEGLLAKMREREALMQGPVLSRRRSCGQPMPAHQSSARQWVMAQGRRASESNQEFEERMLRLQHEVMTRARERTVTRNPLRSAPIPLPPPIVSTSSHPSQAYRARQMEGMSERLRRYRREMEAMMASLPSHALQNDPCRTPRK